MSANYVVDTELFPQSGCINLKNHFIHFNIKQNKRIKRERLLVSPEEGLVIETPKNISTKRAHHLIKDKINWITKSLHQVKKQQNKITNIKKQKNSVLIFGTEKNICVKTHQQKYFIYETHNQIIVGQTTSLNHEQAETDIKEWLRKKATQYIPLRTHFLNKNNFPINKILVKDQKTIWGSCTAEHNLHFSWRLLMAPKMASDYIIIHELCHTSFLNHSKKYWNLVAKVFPEYKKAEKWFKDYGFVLQMGLKISEP